tara:strand:+ start:378 stop:512 length:135 start_codon:yes stop_codon:yes gene_type:complete
MLELDPKAILGVRWGWCVGFESATFNSLTSLLLPVGAGAAKLLH